MESGSGHWINNDAILDGSMAIFFPACPQPNINLPSDWKTRYTPYVNTIYLRYYDLYTQSQRGQLIQTFIMDRNVSAEHMRHRTGEKHVSLSTGMAFVANLDAYKAHLHSGKEIVQACRASLVMQ